MASAKLDKLKTHGVLIAEEMNRDPEFRAEWERTAPAREVAAQLISYRADHDLSQRALAAVLGVSQPRVAKLEAGEHNPAIDTLIRLSEVLGAAAEADYEAGTKGSNGAR
jgi:DNA-binding XRE family transcriptional regulator